MLHLAPEVRGHLLGQADNDVWLGLDAGAAILFDGVPESGTDPARTVTTFAPAFGAAAGVDCAVGEHLSLGVLFRARMLALSRDETRITSQPTYDVQLLLGFGISVTYAWR